MDEYVGKLDSLSEGLRETATYLGVADTGETAERARHLMRLAADRLEHYEAVERERLEHESVTPETLAGHGWRYQDVVGHKGFVRVDEGSVPPIPMRESYGTDEAGWRAFSVDMAAWVRAVTDKEAK
jgi:hypothetical protein